MNHLLCKLNRKYLNEIKLNEVENLMISKDIKNNDIYLSIQREQSDSKKNKSVLFVNNVIICLMGEIYDYQKLNYNVADYEYDIDLVVEMYFKYGIESLQSLNGFFSILIIDFNLRKTFVIQDINTSLEHIYYYVDKKYIYIGTNVKEILNEAQIKKSVNTSILPTYLHYSFVPSEQTLFKGIKKITSEYFLEYDFDKESMNLKNNKIKSENIVYDYSDSKDVISIFDDIISNYTNEKKSKKIGFSLSGGYDSNFLVSRALNFMEDEEINLFSYGYDNPKSEITNAENISNIYIKQGHKINHYKYYAKTEDIFKLPKMIGFLQEPILEPGLLFHYGLSELIEAKSIDILIGGDCNDQIYDTRLYYEMINNLMEPKTLTDYPMYGRLRLGEFDRMHTYKYFTDIETQWILKEKIDYSELKVRLEVYSEVFKNYFMTKRLFVRGKNIITRLPYLNRNYVDFVNSNISERDLPFKKYHVELCKEVMHSDIYNELTKATESTSPYSYLFLENDSIRKDLFNILLSSNVVDEFFNLDSIKKLFNSFEVSLNQGRSNGNYYKASILSCRIFAIIGFVTWYNIFILNKSSEDELYNILKN